MAAADIKVSANNAAAVDTAVESASRNVDSLLHRHLWPWSGTRTFDNPGRDATGISVYFMRHLLISASAVVSGGVSVPTNEYLLRPDDGPPFRKIELDRGTNSGWTIGDTDQRSLAVTGLWGYSNNETQVGTTAEVLDATETDVDGSAMPAVGVGSVIRVDTERMVVTNRTWLTTGQTGSLTALASSRSLTVANGAAFLGGEVLILDSERVRIVDVTGNVLTVDRAFDGSTLAAHTTATIYALRLLTVERGALGTTAATHLTSAPVWQWQPPALAAELAMAYSLNTLAQRQSRYARVVGEGENTTEASGRGIREIEQDAKSALGQVMRVRSV